ncbi:KRAB-A domain-containing protein 2 [Plakobranchus ocellatus]|uniref:KRAB-A domain-containing protein 2 n=1 Tax=Plakobranchus ocellatus TaxID=259542 RepID=A0AAV4CVA5_9GAST|nr:KRAB-A domain-containing protein 2 [Plakobranchus ocellatus]
MTYYASIEETFDVSKSAHISTGRGGRDHKLKELQKKYSNIPTKAVELFKSLCQECQKERKTADVEGWCRFIQYLPRNSRQEVNESN